MKIIEQSLGNNGASIKLEIIDGFIVETAKYPIGEAVKPAHDLVDKIINTAEEKLAFLPGDSEKALLEPVRAAGHAAIDRALASI